MSAAGWLATEPERYIRSPSTRGSEVDVTPGTRCTFCDGMIADRSLIMRDGGGWRHAICPVARSEAQHQAEAAERRAG